MKKMLWNIIITFIVGYILFTALIYFAQKSLLYFPVKEFSATPRSIGLDYEEISIRTTDDITISAWYIPAVKERGTVLFSHGNAGNISHRLDSIKIFNELDLSVFIFDYRGYGKSSGSPDENGTYLDGMAAWDYLIGEKKVDPHKIILFGRSLGGAVAAEIAIRKNPGALIIESGMTSVPDLAKKLYPFLPVRLLARYNYDSLKKVDKIKIPKLFIHSLHDEIIPFEHGRTLFKNAAEPKEFLQIRGDHNSGFLQSGKLYREGLNSFISQMLN